MSKRVLLIIASKDYQPLEYSRPKKVLEEAGAEVATASDRVGIAIAAHGGGETPVDLTLDEVRINDFDGIFFIGGPGALQHLDNEKSYRIIREVASSGKLWGAICISPRILAHAGVLSNKKATGWDGDEKLVSILDSAGARYLRQPVVADGNLLTASGPPAAEEWGKKIVEAMIKLS